MEQVVRQGDFEFRFRGKYQRCMITATILHAIITFALIAYIISRVRDKRAICMTSVCMTTSANLLQSIDRSRDPCVDFQQFACGKLAEAAAVSTSQLLQTEMNARSAFERVFTRRGRVGYLYKTCMNRTRIDAESVPQLRHLLLEAVGGWPLIAQQWDDDGFHWTDTIVMLARRGFRYEIFFELRAHENFTTGWNLLNLEVPAVDARAALAPGFRRSNEDALRAAVQLFGGDKPLLYDIHVLNDFTAEVMKIIAKYQIEPNKDRQVHLKTLEEIEMVTPGIPWRQMLSEITGRNLSEKIEIAFNAQEYFEALQALLRRTPRHIQANYIIWEVLKDLQLWYNLPNAAPISRSSRQHSCIEGVNKILPLLANRVQSEDTGGRFAVQQMAEEIRDRLVNQINDSNHAWLAIAVNGHRNLKSFIMRKLRMTKLFIAGKLVGYPDDLMLEQYIQELNVETGNGSSFMDVITASRIALSRYKFAMIFNGTTAQTTTARLLSMDSMANAFYLDNNYIGLPTGLVNQLYSPDEPTYVNYARIGHLIGHEFSHALSSFALRFDESGAPNQTPDLTISQYRNAHQCLIDLYANYTADTLGVTLNGTETLDENLADLFGAHAAYEAWRHLSHIDTQLPGLEAFSASQLFWMTFARYYCDPSGDSTPEESDKHAIASFRIFGVLSNMPQFAHDFQCPLGSRMHPLTKCAHL